MDSLPLNRELVSSTTMTSYERPSKRSRRSPLKNGDPLTLLLSHTDVWVHHILPFVGPNNFVFVANVCRRFKELYVLYFAAIEHPPRVWIGYHEHVPARVWHTSIANAFKTLDTVRYWERTTRQDADRTLNCTDQLVCQMAAKHGDLAVLQWAHRSGFPWTEKTCCRAAERGKLDQLLYAREHGCPERCFRWVAEYAAKNGHLPILEHAHQRGWKEVQWNEQTCASAAEGGHMDCLLYLRQTVGCPWNHRVCRGAAQNGHLHILKYAHQQGCPWTPQTCSAAARGGHLACLVYAHQQGCDWDETTCNAVATFGRLDILRFAHENGCPISSETGAAAAANGHLKVLQYLVDRGGCEILDESVSEAAAEGGHLSVLVWAIRSGCPWDAGAVEAAIDNGHQDIVQWLQANVCPGADQQEEERIGQLDTFNSQFNTMVPP